MPTHIVGIGASAGGLEALQHLFKPKLLGTNIAFVVVQHLSPNHKSLMPELLSRVTDLPVHTVKDKEEIKGGQIYLNPAGKNIKVVGNLIKCENSDPERQLSNLPINVFFTSLAEELKERAIGIILSGTGSDGAAGLMRINELGGYSLVQTPDTAQFNGMPLTAIAASQVDKVLPPEKLLSEVLNFCALPVPFDYASKEVSNKDQASMESVFKTLAEETGFDFSKYKLPTLARRMQKRMIHCGFKNLQEYAEKLPENSTECTLLAKEFLINVTQFFRDPVHFEALYSEVILPLVQNANPTEPLRIWVPACATGQEAYTIAILIFEAKRSSNSSVDFKVFATDLEVECIRFASRGSYPKTARSFIPAELFARYFDSDKEGFVIKPFVRDCILFAPHDLVSNPPFRNIDFVSCRNVLIYFKPTLQHSIFQKFFFSLKDSGHLFLGTSENISENVTFFKPINKKSKLFQKVANSRPLKTPWPSPLTTPKVKPLLQSSIKSFTAPSFLESPLALKQSTEESVKKLLESLAAPGIIVNSDLSILHFLGNLGEFFVYPTGKATLSVTQHLIPQLQDPVAALLLKVLKDQDSNSSAMSVEIKEDSQNSKTVELVAVRYELGEKEKPLVYLGIKTDTSQKLNHFSVTYNELNITQELQTKLTMMQDKLEATIEALEATNEELQSTNEEMLSANEELQSTNEELQSVNEELHTVNSEYQNKIEELIDLNSDLDNLLIHSEISVVFLDKELCVRKFTETTTNYIYILDQDRGRPLNHLSTRIDYPELIADIHKVILTGNAAEKTCEAENQQTVSVKIFPQYKLGRNLHGVTVIFSPKS